MRKKVFFILSSLRAGGAERVFWLISQNFDNVKYEVCLVLLTTQKSFFPLVIPNVRVINLGTKKASSSFGVLYKLIAKEKPYTIFTTGGQIDILLSILSYFINVPFLIARSTSIPGERVKFANSKSRIFGEIGKRLLLYNRFDKIICQTEEMKNAWLETRNVKNDKLVVIPNPALFTSTESVKQFDNNKIQLIIVASMSIVKGHGRLLEIFSGLPDIYYLTIAGDGMLLEELKAKVIDLGLSNRVKLIGQITNVTDIIAEHDFFVLTSYVEGFPNVALEALSVGVPVISFKVSGISDLIVDGFNGYVVEQEDLNGFRNSLIKAAGITWNKELIREDVFSRYAIGPIVKMYENLFDGI